MTEEELARHDSKTLLQLLLSADARCDALTAERDAAYAQGYSDAETEISESALGQRNDFLRSQYDNAVDRITDLNELLEEAQTEWSKYASAWMTAEGKLEDVEAERDRLREALAIIDAIDPEHHIDGCALTVVRGLVLRMGETARAALKGESHE